MVGRLQIKLQHSGGRDQSRPDQSRDQARGQETLSGTRQIKGQKEGARNYTGDQWRGQETIPGTSGEGKRDQSRDMLKGLMVREQRRKTCTVKAVSFGQISMQGTKDSVGVRDHTGDQCNGLQEISEEHRVNLTSSDHFQRQGI